MICLILFYDKSHCTLANIWPSPVKHVELVAYAKTGCLYYNPAKNGLGVRSLNEQHPDDLFYTFTRTKNLIHALMIDVDQRNLPRSPLIIYSCNEMIRSIAAIDVGFTLSPGHLYRKLLSYQHTSNYNLLMSWSRKNGWRQKRASTQPNIR